ncbi:MAG: hypothetical protein FWE80_01500 [Oscillospiraceae bacterium]|nr:hypothetical protein [Oscillospiraceae bacterium]
MLSTDFIKQLKQSNVSVDKEKTIARVKALWQSTSNAGKQQLLELADISRATIYRIYNTGVISVKTAVPLAMVLGGDPYYLAGKTDEAAAYSDELIKSFLVEHGYQKQWEAFEKGAKKGKRGRKPKKDKEAEIAAAEQIPEPVEDIVEDPAEDVTGDVAGEAGANTLTHTLEDEDLLLLFKAALIKSKAGIDQAAEKVTKITDLLMS